MEKPKLHVVSFSGGKDSTAMLLRMIEEGYPIDIILYCDTGLEWPEMDDHIKKVEEYIGRKITTIKAEHDFMWWATEKEVVVRKVSGEDNLLRYGYGWPSIKVRWCTKHLKIEVIDRYLRDLCKKYEIIQYVGIAADEPNRERDKNYPLITWGMSEADCLKYCYDRGFTWGGLYEHKKRVSCWCCPLQSLKDLKWLYVVRPELWTQLKEMDQAISKTEHFFFTRYGVTLSDIERRFEVEDEFIAQGKKLRTREFFQALKDRSINY